MSFKNPHLFFKFASLSLLVMPLDTLCDYKRGFSSCEKLFMLCFFLLVIVVGTYVVGCDE